MRLEDALQLRKHLRQPESCEIKASYTTARRVLYCLGTRPRDTSVSISLRRSVMSPPAFDV